MLANRNLLRWFERRGKSKILNLAQAQIIQAINTVYLLERALTAFSQSKTSEVEATLQRLFAQEVEIDDLRRAVFEGLTKDELPPKYREDLKELVGQLDVMADNIKDSARSVTILMMTTVPRDILDKYVEVAKDLSACAAALGDCIEILGLNPAKVIEIAKKVYELEEKVDDGYVSVKLLLLKHPTTIDTATLFHLWDLINHMEHVADRCAVTTEFLLLAAEAS